MLAMRIAPLFAHIALIHIPLFFHNEALTNKYKSIYVRRVASTSMTTGR